MKPTTRILALCTLALALAPAPARAETVVATVNAERARHDLPPLKPSPHLRRSADRFAHRLMREDRFAHESRIPASRTHFHHLGEALALHFGPERGPATTVHAWLRSPPHRRLLLTRTMNLIGAGEARGTFRGRQATIHVLHLAR